MFCGGWIPNLRGFRLGSQLGSRLTECCVS